MDRLGLAHTPAAIRCMRCMVRPGYAGPEGGNDEFLKFGISSCGCKSRPTNAEPGRSAASLAVVTATGRRMRRQASTWAAGIRPRNAQSREAQGAMHPEGNSGRHRDRSGEAASAEAGWLTTARVYKDEPVTGETPVWSSEKWGRGQPNSSEVSDAPPVLRTHGRPVQKSVRSEVGRGQGEPESRPMPQGSRRAA
jgi:hypothetical protein